MPSYGPPQASSKAPPSKQPSTRVFKVGRDCIGCENYSIIVEILGTANRAISALASAAWSLMVPPVGLFQADLGARAEWAFPAEWRKGQFTVMPLRCRVRESRYVTHARLRFGFELWRACTAWLRRVVEPKLNFDCRGNNHGFAVLCSGAEPPLLHRLNGFLVETRTKTALKSNIVRSAVGVDLDVQDDCLNV